jgi:hypothetical protein
MKNQIKKVVLSCLLYKASAEQLKTFEEPRINQYNDHTHFAQIINQTHLIDFDQDSGVNSD